MKLIPVIFLLCFVGAVSAQTLRPDPEPEKLPDSLLDTDPSKLTVPKKPSQKDEEKKEGVPVGERPDIQPTPDEGIAIQVEKSAMNEGASKSGGSVKVYSPWPAKPMFPAPDGWKFAPAPEGMAPYRTQVKLSSGQQVSLAITPFVLIPVTDGLNTIRIMEPGYRPDLGYVQRDTVGVMLQKSTDELRQNEKQAADSIRRLQQLLSSLPKKTSP